MSKVYDITIIGAGPVGLFTAFYAGLRNQSVKIIDSLEEAGGQPRYLYPEKTIYDIPAYPAINGHDLTKNLLTQLQRFDITYALGETLESFEFTPEERIFTLHSDKKLHYSKSIIIAAGNGAFAPKRINLEHADDLENKQVHYYVSNLDKFKDQRVMICGGGDSALDWALMLKDIAKEVHLVHRRDSFRAHESSVSALKQSPVNIYTPYIPESLLLDESGQLVAINLNKVKSTENIQIPIDQLIVSYGFASSISTIRSWGIEIDRNAIAVNHQLETSIPGVFAVGDIAQYEGKLKLIATGFGEAPLAVQNAMLFINPELRIIPVHSSDILE